ncbi:hypothetical protein ACJX0J_013092, partial [Zea mays]
ILLSIKYHFEKKGLNCAGFRRSELNKQGIFFQENRYQYTAIKNTGVDKEY